MDTLKTFEQEHIRISGWEGGWEQTFCRGTSRGRSQPDWFVHETLSNCFQGRKRNKSNYCRATLCDATMGREQCNAEREVERGNVFDGERISSSLNHPINAWNKRTHGILLVNWLEIVQGIKVVCPEIQQDSYIHVMKYLFFPPIGTKRMSERGSTLQTSASCLNHNRQGLLQNVSLVQQSFGSVKGLLTLKWTMEISICSNWPHSPPFTTGGHGYSRLCWLVAIKDFKDKAVNTLALRLTTWPSDALLVESCNRKWTKDYSDHNQSGNEKGLRTRGY